MLHDESINVMGYNIFGTPWRPDLYRYAKSDTWMKDNSNAHIDRFNKTIPDTTDILLSR